jgi:DNA polymerase III subunit epsilon
MLGRIFGIFRRPRTPRAPAPGESLPPARLAPSPSRRLAGIGLPGASQIPSPSRRLRRPGARPASLLASMDFVVVDVETTGWLPEQAMIIEIGAVRLCGGQVTGEFSALVNPGSPIPADIAALTGITDEMVSQAPPMAQVFPGFLAFAEGCVLAAHNAPFDIGFLTAACRSCSLPWPAFPVIDTAVLARLVLSGDDVPDRKLATLATYFATQTAPCHRALADAKATAGVLDGLLALLAEAGARTLAEVSA